MRVTAQSRLLSGTVRASLQRSPDPGHAATVLGRGPSPGPGTWPCSLGPVVLLCFLLLGRSRPFLGPRPLHVAFFPWQALPVSLCHAVAAGLLLPLSLRCHLQGPPAAGASPLPSASAPTTRCFLPRLCTPAGFAGGSCCPLTCAYLRDSRACPVPWCPQVVSTVGAWLGAGASSGCAPISGVCCCPTPLPSPTPAGGVEGGCHPWGGQFPCSIAGLWGPQMLEEAKLGQRWVEE